MTKDVLIFDWPKGTMAQLTEKDEYRDVIGPWVIRPFNFQFNNKNWKSMLNFWFSNFFFPA